MSFKKQHSGDSRLIITGKGKGFMEIKILMRVGKFNLVTFVLEDGMPLAGPHGLCSTCTLKCPQNLWGFQLS
jgi:hypothetical protein